MKTGCGLHLALWTFALVVRLTAAAPLPAGPEQTYGRLFADVQRSGLFADQKTFPDAVPRAAPDAIRADYEASRAKPGFDLRRFVTAHFVVPAETSIRVPAGEPLPAHLRTVLGLLRRAPDRPAAGSSLLALPAPYVIPGGRFREVYYWDSYFTMLGLRELGEEATIAGMIENFAHLLRTYGFIPNGNRTYYLTRSQPPFFALMVELLAQKQGDAVYRKYADALRIEYAYWTDRSAETRHGVTLPDGAVMTRYWDRGTTPRAEAFTHDEAAAAKSAQPAPELYRNLRSACESGWDFSTRWFADGGGLPTIRTTRVVPVDLNCLLQHLELALAHAAELEGDRAAEATYRRAADARAAAVRMHCWSDAEHFFVDFDLDRKRPAGECTLAGVVPLFLRVATPEQAAAVAGVLRARFLRPGGVVTTLKHSGQQWDAPNGWAPLEWMTVVGLENYGEHALAREIASRWIAVNARVYRETGRMLEKYDVEDLTKPGGGGEYPTQDGFGWTNGVLLALLARYGP